MKSRQERKIKIGDLSIAIIEWNRHLAGKSETIVAFHGWLDNAESFTPLARCLKNRHLIAVDFLGHGKSDHLPKGMRYYYFDLLPFIFNVADVLCLKKFHLMGHSMGAGAASIAAGIFPERIEKMILVEGLGPMTQTADEIAVQMRKSITQYERTQNREMPPYETRERAIQARQTAGDMTPQSAAMLVKRGLKKNQNGYNWRYDKRLKVASLLRMNEEQVAVLLKNTTASTLLIYGDDGMKELITAFSGRVQYIKNISIHKLKGGHHLHMDNPEGVAAVIEEFLQNENN